MQARGDAALNMRSRIFRAMRYNWNYKDQKKVMSQLALVGRALSRPSCMRAFPRRWYSSEGKVYTALVQSHAIGY